MHQHSSGRKRFSKWNSLYRVVALTALILSSAPAQSAPLDYRHFAESAYRYADIAYASYTDAATRALELKNALFHFATEPDANKLTETRAAWLATIDAYSKTEAFRFPGGPMDDDQALGDKVGHWPLDQAYLDYLQGIPDCGLINDVETYPKIDEDLLLTLHKKDGPNRITLGFHPIQFLLWGQDTTPQGTNPQDPVSRPHTDFLADGSRPNATRRLQYLIHAADLLLQHLEQAAAQWHPQDPENFRASFLSGDPKAAVQNVLTGLSTFLSHTLPSKLQAPFPAATTLILQANTTSLHNIYRGSYATTAGPGINTLIRAADPALQTQFRNTLQALILVIQQLPQQFHQALEEEEERSKIAEAIRHTQALQAILDEAIIALPGPTLTSSSSPRAFSSPNPLRFEQSAPIK